MCGSNNISKGIIKEGSSGWVPIRYGPGWEPVLLDCTPAEGHGGQGWPQLLCCSAAPHVLCSVLHVGAAAMV